MAENSKIQWTTHTFNPWRGCTKVSSGCAHCYAETQSKRNTKTLGMWGPNGTRVVASEAMWKEPVKWNRQAGAINALCRADAIKVKPERPRVFCASMADVFENWQQTMVDSAGEVLFKSPLGSWCTGGEKKLYDEGHIPNTRPPEVTMPDVRQRLFDLIDNTKNIDWLLLTKRPENIGRMMDQVRPVSMSQNARPNVWLSTSVEDQKTADERIPHLLKVPAAVRFLSVEPLLGEVNLDAWLPACCERGDREGESPCPYCIEVGRKYDLTGIHWVIIGGESGPGARPCNVEWIRDIVKQCKAAGVKVFVKQLGAKPQMRWAEYRDWHPCPPAVDCHPDTLETIKLRDPKGGDMEEWPEDLRVREIPKAGVS